jgi:hypothetical protein
MKHLWAVVVLVVLGACDRPADQAAAPQDEPAVAVTSAAAPARDDYPPGYAEMKVAAAIFAKDTYGDFKSQNRIVDASGNEVDAYAVEDCAGGFEIAEMNTGGDPRQLELEGVAREIAKHRHYLSQLYPPAVWEEPLRDYEKKSIELTLRMPPPPDWSDAERPENPLYDQWESQRWKLKEELAGALENNRQRLEPGEIPVTVGGECGAGEQPYLVKTEPADGRLWVTTKFSFDLCRARKLDPWNTEACRWTELSPTEPAYLAGRYVYQAQWRDGARRRGIRAFDGVPGPDSEEATVVVIKAA